MEQSKDLLNGRIVPVLTKLAIPIVGTSFLEMAYNLVDMIWIGRLGANSVAAIGVAGMFAWFSAGLALIARAGGQVKVGHSLGANKQEEAHHYASCTFQIGIVFALSYALIACIFAPQMIHFFGLTQPETIKEGIIYMRIICGFMVINYMNMMMTAIMNATGDSHTPFTCNTTGLIANMILDPLFIFGFGPIPHMGVMGAAIATILAQVVVFCVFKYRIHQSDIVLNHVNIFKIYDRTYYLDILKIGFPLGLESMLFSICSMIIAKFVATYGESAIAAQKIGTQVESISWNMADGFQLAINAFIAQNYGAKKYDRVNKGYHTILVIGIIWGVMCTAGLMIFPHLIYQIFVSDPHVIRIGVTYLRILALSQILMIIEITISGAFSGLGNSVPPSIISIIFTFGRVPVIMLLMMPLGLNGIWWTISMSSVIKGIVALIWFHAYKEKTLHPKELSSQ